MLPLLEKSFQRENNDISGSLKRRVGTRIATKNGLDHKKVSNVIKDLRGIKKEKEFVTQLEDKLKEEFDLNEKVRLFL
jgi:hypothetical protein